MSAELKSGSRLGRYELLIQLGRGGMASVWVAREWSPSGARQRLVALKAMLPELARQPDFRSMFLEEGQIVRSIDHPNVVKVFEVSEDRGILYMAMDWVEGDSLRGVIKEARRRRAIPPEMAVRIIADTAAGLHAAHELRGWDGELRNLVHCDVSPHNILVGLDGRAKLVDFGVANATVHSEVGQTDTIKGKFAYMSPEQAQAQAIDRRSDIFALGIVLFELTTGERLFRGENAAHTLKLVTSGKIPDPRELHAQYPESLAQIVSTALERDVEKRYQTADELKAALEKYLVDARIMVSVASVGQLVKRVLGEQLAERRVRLRDALIAADGSLKDGLIPSSALRDGPVPSAPGSSTPGANPWGVPSGRSSDPPTNSQSSGTGTPFQQTLDATQVRRRSPWGGLIFAVFGVGAAIASILWVKNRSDPAPLMVSNAGVSTHTASARVQRTLGSEADPSGVSIDDLPLAQQQLAVERASPGGARPNPKSPADKKRESEKPGQKDSATKAPAVEAQPEPAPPPPPPPAAPDPEPGTAGPFNRGAAMATLGGTAIRASSCKRSGEPSGAGRAMVTFKPNGSVSAVVVSSPFAGTSVGNCVAGLFRGAHVPAFEGGAITLPQSFRIPED